MKRGPVILAVLLLLAGTVGVALVLGGGKDSSGGAGTAKGPAATVTCLGGSEKSELMADPELTKLLRERFGLVVDFQPMGSYEQVQLTTAQLKERGVDCLWPSSGSAQLVFEELHDTGEFAGYKANTVLQSPEVLYAGPQGTAALVKRGVVAEREGRYFIVDMKALLQELVLKERTWGGLGATDIAGPVAISSTDPAKSNSGFTLYQLMLSIIATDSVYRPPTAAQAFASLGTVRRLYDAQGQQAKSSDGGFEQWLLQGAELHAPLYAGYENQVIQKVLQSEGNASVRTQLQDNVRILYPDPTIYADHPILAFDDTSARFVAAMRDPEVQRLAWKRYGFRSGVQIGLSDPADFKDLPLAGALRTTAPPNAEVTLALLKCVQRNVCRQE